MSRRSERKLRVKRQLAIRKLQHWVPIALRLQFGERWRRLGLRVEVEWPNGESFYIERGH